MNLSSLVILIMTMILFVGFASCKSKSEESKEVSVDMTSVDMVASESATESNSPPPVPPPPNSTNKSTSDQSTDNIAQDETNNIQQKNIRKLIKEGRLTFETDNLEKTNKLIQEQCKKLNGYVSKDNLLKDEYTITNYMEIRIPTDQFDAFLNSVENSYKKFDEKNIEVLDVSEEYVDVQSRIKTKKELEQRYFDILNKANKVSELLEVESQLNNVRNDIESAEGRLKYLNDRIAYSTFYIHFYETTSAPIGFFGELGKSFVAGWKGILYFILGLVSLWPIVLIIGIVIYWLIKRRRNKL